MVGIEHIDELVQRSVKNVQSDDPELLSSGRIKLVGESGDVRPVSSWSVQMSNHLLPSVKLNMDGQLLWFS